MISKVPDCEYYMSINLLCAVKEQKYTAQLLCNILACTSWIYLTVWMVQALLIAILFNLYAAMRTPNQIIWAISRSSHILTDFKKFYFGRTIYLPKYTHIVTTICRFSTLHDTFGSNWLPACQYPSGTYWLSVHRLQTWGQRANLKGGWGCPNMLYLQKDKSGPGQS